MRDNPWEGLPPGSPGTLSVLRVPNLRNIEAFWGRKPDGRLALLIALQRVEDAPSDLPKVRGVEVLVLAADGQLQLVLESAGDWEMFRALCLDLLSASNEGSDEPSALQLLVSRLLRWQRFLSKGGGKLLDEREVRGLIGELLFLRDYLIATVGTAAVECWQGPLGLPQDFVFDGRLVEVKTFAAGSDPSVRITSAEQLTSGDVPLFLHLVCLVRQDDGLTLPDLVDDLRRLLTPSYAATESFEDRLLTIGYVDLPEYRAMSYAVTSVGDYVVRDGFPRLTSEQIPAGVKDVAYSVRLADMRSFAVPAGVVTSTVGAQT
ncbi:PD-(D/E)XK motif protein [Burkholderia gladioli]|uniref:PD-(D/E)XK motif protein n=1 Tax=Burkholderia gladioli TaxID=28095 RepID=UPI0016405051|nr:PD-(D/E)XK motif protein [Burkholderia gladioli]